MNETYLIWNPDPELINLFGISIRYYGLLFVAGLIIAVQILGKIFAKEGIHEKNIETLSVYGTFGIFIGARLFHCLFYDPAHFLAYPLEIIIPMRTIEGVGQVFVGFQGLASHGGALGMGIALALYTRKTKHSFLEALDLISIVGPLAAGFIRIANLMNSEIIGIQTSKPWGFIFEKIDGVPRHPVQLYEAISYFAIFTIMMVLYKKKRSSLKNGFFFGLAITLTFLSRFFLEVFKENQAPFEAGMILNLGQLLSIPYIIVGLGFIVYGIKKGKQVTT